MLKVAPECWLDEVISTRTLAVCGYNEYTFEKATTFSDAISKLFTPRPIRLVSVVDAVRDKNQKKKNDNYKRLALQQEPRSDIAVKRVEGKEAFLIEFSLTAEDWLRAHVPASFFTKHRVDRNLEARTKSISVRNYTELRNLLDDFLRNEPTGQELVSLFRSLLPA